jgi:peptide/nickel transport system permease protein
MTESIQSKNATWRRLKKNKGALFGLIVICIAIIISVFAYFIAPDDSPYANRIILEIGGEKPGFKKEFLLVKKDRTVPSSSFFHWCVY